MNRLAGVAGVLFVLLLSVSFAALNGNQRVTLRLGFTTLYQVPLSVVAFGALVIGMMLMLVTGIHSDLKVRRIRGPQKTIESVREIPEALTPGHDKPAAAIASADGGKPASTADPSGW